MKLSKKIFGLLALLFLGSASLMAQTDEDPFPDVNIYAYPDVMIILGQVRLGGEVQEDGTVVAVYCGDEIRGKGVVKSKGKRTNYFSFNIYGDQTAQTEAPLYFKVFCGGRIIEADLGLTFTGSTEVGSLKDYYYIDLPTPVTSQFVATADDPVEYWATTCLPFDARVPDGVTLWNATAIENGALVMEQISADVLPKSTPVLLQGESATTCEWLSAVIDEETLAQQCSMFNVQSSILKGTTETTTVEANSVLTLGHSKEGKNELGFWLFTGTEVPANRVYIANFPAGSRGAALHVGDGTTTGVGATLNDNGRMANEERVYDLQGRCLSKSQVSARLKDACHQGDAGRHRSQIVIINGKKTLVK